MIAYVPFVTYVWRTTWENICMCFVVMIFYAILHVFYSLPGTYAILILIIDTFTLLHRPPMRTHPPTVIQGFCADAHGLTMK